MREHAEDIIAVETFKKVMLSKLKENLEKPGWRSLSKQYLFFLLLQEVIELYEALEITEMNKAKIQREAADVANFAMMISDNMENVWSQYGVER